MDAFSRFSSIQAFFRSLFSRALSKLLLSFVIAFGSNNSWMHGKIE